MHCHFFFFLTKHSQYPQTSAGLKPASMGPPCTHGCWHVLGSRSLPNPCCSRVKKKNKTFCRFANPMQHPNKPGTSISMRPPPGAWRHSITKAQRAHPRSSRSCRESSPPGSCAVPLVGKHLVKCCTDLFQVSQLPAIIICLLQGQGTFAGCCRQRPLGQALHAPALLLLINGLCFWALTSAFTPALLYQKREISCKEKEINMRLGWRETFPEGFPAAADKDKDQAALGHGATQHPKGSAWSLWPNQHNPSGTPWGPSSLARFSQAVLHPVFDEISFSPTVQWEGFQ